MPRRIRSVERPSPSHEPSRRPPPHLGRIARWIDESDAPVAQLAGWPGSGRHTLLIAFGDRLGDRATRLSLADVSRRSALDPVLASARARGAQWYLGELWSDQRVLAVVDRLRPGERLIVSLGPRATGSLSPDRSLVVGPQELMLTVEESGSLAQGLAMGDLGTTRVQELWSKCDGWLGALEQALIAKLAPSAIEDALAPWLRRHVWERLPEEDRQALIEASDTRERASPDLFVPNLLRAWVAGEAWPRPALSRTAPSAPVVRLRLLGPPQLARVHGEDERPLAWSHRHVVRLLALLALGPDRLIARSRVLATLWPELEERNALKHLNPTLSHLRRLLGRSERCGSAVLREHDAYRLNPAWTWDVDVWRFQDLAREGRSDVAAAQTARSLYRGPLFEGNTERWIEEERERLARLRADLLLDLAGGLAEAGDLAEAEACYRSLLLEDPFLEEVHLGLMRVYAGRGRLDLVRRQYERLSRLLLDELGSQPMDATVREIQRLIG